jgi:hypothetical protein
MVYTRRDRHVQSILDGLATLLEDTCNAMKASNSRACRQTVGK